MIPRQEFGRTGHKSTRVIFGSWALNRATQAEANRALALLQEYGVNHIDTAPMYGNAEKIIGPWLAKQREDFFVATKTRCHSRREALDNLKRSLERLRVDYIDLWQMHGLTNPVGWEKVMGPGGALEDRSIKKTLEHVVNALESKGLSTKGREDNISNSLARRVNKGVLKRCETSGGWNYWTE